MSSPTPASPRDGVAAATPMTSAQLLSQYDVSRNGFLPSEAPLAVLPSPYYAPWERIVKDLSTLAASRQLRTAIDQIDVLSTDHLTSESEWRRAYVILSFFAHGYIWGGDVASEVLPPNITVPYLKVSQHFDLPPVATYAALNLWNFTSTSGDLTNLDTLSAQHTFTGTADESWFYALSTAMEAQGGYLIPLLISALEAIPRHDYAAITPALEEMVAFVHRAGELLERMYERNRPQVFYHRIRPFLAGSKNMAAAGLPRGVFYDEGDGKGSWRQLRGGSNGQSSLIQFMDLVLGIKHESAGSPHHKPSSSEGEKPFHEEVRSYMPGPHRALLTHISTTLPSLRSFVQVPYPDAEPRHAQLQKVYQAAAKALSEFRNIHLKIVTRYIIIPSSTAAAAAKVAAAAAAPAEQKNEERDTEEKETTGVPVKNLATVSAGQAAGNNGADLLTGTGGTALIPFLKKTRDETFMAGDLSTSKTSADEETER